MGGVRIWVLVAVLAIAGCGGRKSQKREAASAKDGGITATHVLTGSGQPPPNDAPDIKLPRLMRFTLVDAGTGARAELRYRLDSPARELVARSTVTTHANIDATWADPITLATVHDGFGVSASAGVVQLRGLDARIDDGTPAAVAAAEKYVMRWRALVAKRRADVKVDARGQLDSITLLDDPTGKNVDAREELVQRWLALAVPLPAEPVGVGASWKVVMALRAGGAVVKQTTTYTLVAVDGDTWSIDMSSERIGEPQMISVPGTGDSAATMIAELIAHRRVVIGQVVVGKGDPLPLRGKLTADVSSHARVKVAGRLSEHFSDDKATTELGPPP